MGPVALATGEATGVLLGVDGDRHQGLPTSILQVLCFSQNPLPFRGQGAGLGPVSACVWVLRRACICVDCGACRRFTPRRVQTRHTVEHMCDVALAVPPACLPFFPRVSRVSAWFACEFVQGTWLCLCLVRVGWRVLCLGVSGSACDLCVAKEGTM